MNSNVVTLFLIIQSIFTQSHGKLSLRHRDYIGDPDLTGDLRVFKKTLQIQEPKVRLYNSIIPKNYTLRIRPILGENDSGKAWSAPGTVHILVDCKESTNNITLHSGVDINEKSVKVALQPNGNELKPAGFSRDPEKDFFTIFFDSNVLIANESYRISIDFTADIFISGEKYHTGIYRSHYTEPITQETRYLVSTQFQPFGARLAFPCFDEPSFKSTFEVTIGRLASNYTAVSNTPLKTSVPNEDQVGWVWDTFVRTIPMSTYLVAWIVSDYESVKAREGLFDKPVQTLAPKHIIDAGYGNYSADLVARQLTFYESYFLAKYPIDKMDSAGIVDFADSAMENPGLNIYSPSVLYYSKEENTEKGRQSTSIVIAHELAHQWFGNLVTCKWWSDFWLNEGFASHVEYLGVRNTTPEFEPEKTRLTVGMQYAMRFDVLETSHQVQLSAIRDPRTNLKTVFMYPILYKKSAALIRMMEGFLTEKTLQLGLQKFLKKFSFQSVEQDDLFAVLTEQAHSDHKLPPGVTMKEIMNTWTLQRGYPLIRVSVGGHDRIYITQEKLALKNVTEKNARWYIPVAVATKADPKLGSDDSLPSFWINTTSTVTNWNHNTSKWIILNSGATGYYRVLYDDHLTKLIREQMIENHTLIHHGTRSQLFDDQFTLAFEGYSEIEVALRLTKYLGRELEYTVWTPIIRHLRRLYNLLEGDGVILFQKYFEPILSQVFQVINYEQNENETGNIVLFRSELLEWACEIQHPDCVQYSLKLWQKWKAEPEVNELIDLY